MKFAEGILRSIQTSLERKYSRLRFLPNLNIVVAGLAFGVGTSAFADFRFDNFCVTSPGSKLVLVYDDLIWSHNEYVPKKFKVPESKLRALEVVAVYDFEDSTLPTEFNLIWHGPYIHKSPDNKEWPSPTAYMVPEYGSALNNSWAAKVIKAPNIVKMEDGKVIVTKKKKVLFSFPFLIQRESPKYPLSEFETITWKGEHLIFDGKPVASVTYHACGMGAD
ncbi:MAG: hypothetical protein IPK04_08670 [Bdellovibrionales bacterium]|jgi:hypothetical protein|nr:hypothetical protein [Bdellovibrionales bacterium]